MSAGRSKLDFQPRLLRRQNAAAYMGVSPSHFDQLVKSRVLPEPKSLKSVQVWDRNDLDRLADELPYRDATKFDNSWD